MSPARSAAAGAGGDGAAARPGDRSVLGVAAVARRRPVGAEARLRLAAGRLDAACRASPGPAHTRPGRGRGACPTTAARAARRPCAGCCSAASPRKGIEASPDQILLTGSGTQAIDLICRFLLRPGDTVLVDDPCYFNFQALLRAHRVKIVGVPYTPTGPDIAAFEAALPRDRPRLYITNSALHNPTGATLSPQTAHRLLSAAVGARPDHRRGRHLRRFRAGALAAPCRARRARTASSGSAASPRRCPPRSAAATSPRGRTGSKVWSISRSPRASADRARSRPN